VTVILLNKPCGVLSQFTGRGTLAGGGEGARATLSDYIDVPGVYPAERLDRDSDGLLILIDDGALQARISSPKHTTPKTYLAQVEGEPAAASLDRLRAGVMVNDGPTHPATVRRIDPPQMWDRDPPVRYRKSVPGKHGSN
jgi:23S rRNA pseudouridine2457 synthase